MTRDFTNVIRYLMDEWLPPAIRDSRWFMWPFFWMAYRGRNIDEVMDFKTRVHSFTPREYARFYNELDSISRHRLTDLNRQCLEYLLAQADPAARSLLDVGCGNGFLLERFHERHPGLQLTGLDIKDPPPHAVPYRYVRGDVGALPFADRSFDVVVCSHTLEHLLDPRHCARELARVARRQLFVVTPCQRPYYYTLDEHLNFFPFRASLTALLPLENHECLKLRGDWMYRGTPEREVASGPTG